ncbi:arsenate reductase ArsC [Alienimonas californiensis]|uniref:Arsenate-mycothiol transferase ArsC2 n=1 Tax=Alienimonas californiensis TaxID=2527989 RepID=A0A517P835_9PLAN|nr:arsenate reductase ArsC [Alienimonas californiensis]QDT15541.1 Arsenate-mycothiol transferase ArsC2 [Alienimonas californiensis]
MTSPDDPLADRLGGARSKPLVLILCTGNSCRSQMAEGFLRRFHGHRFAVRSAGTKPADAVHPLAVRVMAEAGVGIHDALPTRLGEYLGRLPVRHLLIVCDHASETCPRIWPGAVTRHVLPFDDPAAVEGTEDQKLAVFRRVRDEIETAMTAYDPKQTEGDLVAAEATR